MGTKAPEEGNKTHFSSIVRSIVSLPSPHRVTRSRYRPTLVGSISLSSITAPTRCRSSAIARSLTPSSDVAGWTGVSQMANGVVLYICDSNSAWYTEGLASGFSSGYQTFSVPDGLTAHAGGGQANGTPFTAMTNQFLTVATAGDSAHDRTRVSSQRRDHQRSLGQRCNRSRWLDHHDLLSRYSWKWVVDKVTMT
jgi:hypothetical protein